MSDVEVIDDAEVQDAVLTPSDVEDREHKRRLRWLSPLCYVVTLGLLGLHFFAGIGLSTVLTGSMRPTFAPGDAVITHHVSLTSLHKGDILIYRPPDASYMRAHRIVSITWKGDSARVVTKGDANPSADPPVQIGMQGGPVVIGTIPKLGYVLRWFNPSQPRSRSLLVGLIGLLITVGAVRRALRTDVDCSCRSCTEDRALLHPTELRSC